MSNSGQNEVSQTLTRESIEFRNQIKQYQLENQMRLYNKELPDVTKL